MSDSGAVDIGELPRIKVHATLDGISWEIVSAADEIRARADQIEPGRTADNLRTLADHLIAEVAKSVPRG